MSDASINTAISSQNRQAPSDWTISVPTALVWKELRLTGLYAILLMGAGFALLAILQIGIAYNANSSSFTELQLRQTINYQISICLVIPILVTLVGAATTFAIEHENRSFQFIRSLPFASGTLARTKMLVAAALGVFACLIFWSIILLKCYRNGMDHWFLNRWHVPVQLTVSVYLWAIYCSMVSKSVTWAICKTGLGLFLVFVVPESISLLDMKSSSDWIYSMIGIATTVASSVVLAILIFRKSTMWSLDLPAKSSVPFQSLFPVREITEHGSDTWSAPFLRLFWLQWRTGWYVILATSALMLWVLMNRVEFLNEHASRWHGVFDLPGWSWSGMVLAGVLGCQTFIGIQGSRGMIAQQNYSRTLVWVSQLAIPFAICLLGGLLADWFVESEYQRPFAETKQLLLGLAMGQFFSFIFRNYIVAVVAMALCTWCALLFDFYVSTFFSFTWPSWLGLIVLPFAATLLAFRRWLCAQNLGAKFYFSVLVCGAIVGIPYPIARTIELPVIAKEVIDQRLEEASSVDKQQLQVLRQMAVNETMTAAKWDTNGDSSPNDFPRVEEIIALDPGPISILMQEQPAINDLVLYRDIILEFRRTVSNSQNEQDDRIHALKLKMLNSAGRFVGDSHVAAFDDVIRIAQDKRTSPQQIRSLISEFENENRYDFYRSAIRARYRVTKQALDSSETIHGLPILLSTARRLLFWERIRERRALDLLLMQSMDFVDELELSQKQEETWKQRIEKTGYPNKPEGYNRFPLPLALEYRNFDFRGFALNHFNCVFEQRMIRIGLAIVLWQKENGDVPLTSLDQLIGKYLNEIPKNLIDGSPIYFAPNGLEAEFIRPNGPTRKLHAFGIDGNDKFSMDNVANQPFLWVNRWAEGSGTVADIKFFPETIDAFRRTIVNPDEVWTGFYVIKKLPELEE